MAKPDQAAITLAELKQHPARVYVGRLKCGCVMGIANDYSASQSKDLRKGTAQALNEFIREGMKVESVAWNDYKTKVSAEPYFMSCPHSTCGQLALGL